VLECVAVCGRVLQHVATCCSWLQSIYESITASVVSVGTEKHTATSCNILQHTATHCNSVLQCIDIAIAASVVFVGTEKRTLLHVTHGEGGVSRDSSPPVPAPIFVHAPTHFP